MNKTMRIADGSTSLTIMSLSNECGLRNEKAIYREDVPDKSIRGQAASAKKILNSDFMDQGNDSTELAEVRVAVMYADAVGSLQKKPSRILRLRGSIPFGLIFFCALSSVLWLLSSASPALAISGREIYENVHGVWKKALNRTTQVTMILYDKRGGKRTRTLVEYGRKTGDEAYKTLILFKTPADLKNVGFLIHARTFADRDLWAYFPEYRRIRRIPTSNQDDSFFGSDFSYDDFGGPPELDDYKFDILKEETVDGMPSYVVEVTSKVRRKFTRYVAWVSKEHWVHLRIDYYQDKEMYRTGTFRDIRVVDGVPTPFHMEMENRKTSHRTEIIVEKVRYNVNNPDSLFTQRALERGGK